MIWDRDLCLRSVSGQLLLDAQQKHFWAYYIVDVGDFFRKVLLENDERGIVHMSINRPCKAG